MSKMYGILRAMDRYATGNYGEDSVAADRPTECDWCGYKTDHLSVKPVVDGSGTDHTLCRRCVGRYNQEAREYRAKRAGR